MSRRILKNRRFLEYYLEADGKQRKKLLENANKDQIDSLCECALNVVKRNIPIDEATKSSLCKHKQAICKVALTKQPLTKRKKILVQKGGAFLPLILQTVLPLLASALFSKN